MKDTQIVMTNPSYSIDPIIESAETLPASFYRDPHTFEQIKEDIFYRSWQFVGDDRLVQLPGHVHPFTLMDGFLTEPMVLTRGENNEISCLSNVCTHRGNLVVGESGKKKKLICAYHGRRFDLNGSFEYMPEFQDAKDFPRECDNLHRFSLEKLGPLIFAKMGGDIDFGKIIQDISHYIGFLPLEEFIYSEPHSKDYLVNAHWALYVDNYLEGFHIPFVHHDLNAVLDYQSYETVIGDHFNVQIGVGQPSENLFELPDDHPHSGQPIAAYYFWVFPNIMLNFYPWGLSVNVVRPLSLNQTKVSFLTYIYDQEKFAQGATELLDKVEREDEFVVEGVQKGVKSRYYQSGRFSPQKEKGVHHFHQLLSTYLSGNST